MDERLEKALDFSNFRMIISTRQKNLKSLFDNKTLFHYNGGIFKVTTEFISFVFLIQQSHKEFIFIDQNDIPILIEDVREFYKAAYDKYSIALNQYYDSYKKLSEAREIRKALEWDDER